MTIYAQSRTAVPTGLLLLSFGTGLRSQFSHQRSGNYALFVEMCSYGRVSPKNTTYELVKVSYVVTSRRCGEHMIVRRVDIIT